MWLNRWGGWFVLGSLALITTWLTYRLENREPVSDHDQAQIPDYTLKKFKSTQMDEQGRLKNQLVAETMRHYPEVNMELTAPVMVFYREEQPAWTVRAEQGEVSPDGNQVWLLGHTTLLRHTQEPQKTLEIISQDVLIQKDKEFAETAAATTILSHNGETHSVGIRVFMPTEKIELLSQVRGHYALP